MKSSCVCLKHDDLNYRIEDNVFGLTNESVQRVVSQLRRDVPERAGRSVPLMYDFGIARDDRAQEFPSTSASTIE